MSSAESQLHAWADVLDDSDYYELLGVLHIADDTAIRQGFHVFAAAFHPDAHRYSDGADQRLATQIYHRGTEAYRVLLDPKLRSRYDLELAKGNLRLSALGVSCRPGGSRPDNGPKPRLLALTRSRPSKTFVKHRQPGYWPANQRILSRPGNFGRPGTRCGKP